MAYLTHINKMTIKIVGLDSLWVLTPSIQVSSSSLLLFKMPTSLQRVLSDVVRYPVGILDVLSW